MNDIEITAMGSFGPGEYGRVEVDGVGRCDGAFSAQELEVNGTLKTCGAVRADRADVDGALSCQGRLDAGEMDVDGAVTVGGSAGVETLSVDGAFTVHGPLECTSISCDGVIRANGSVTAGSITVDGTLTAKGDISADSVTVDGALQADGQVSADTVKVDGSIRAAEVVGDNVCISSMGSGIHIRIGGFELTRALGKDRRGPFGSQVGLIEATRIELEGVAAQTVNGTHITIGPSCVIDSLDCNGTLSIDPGAEVKNISGNYVRED